MPSFEPNLTSGHCRKCGIRDDHLVNGMCVADWCKEMDERDGITYRYFLSDDDTPEHEVTKEEWVQAERNAGFNNTLGHPDEPGTAGFSTSRLRNLKGRIERVGRERGDAE